MIVASAGEPRGGLVFRLTGSVLCVRQQNTVGNGWLAVRSQGPSPVLDPYEYVIKLRHGQLSRRAIA